MEKQEILDEFGKLIVEHVYDDIVRFHFQLINNETMFGYGKEYTLLLNKLDEEDQKLLTGYIKKTIGNTLFGLFSLLEWKNQYKLVFSDNDSTLDLQSLSDDFKAEIITSRWIARFSKFKDEKK